jgi:hypothetical protein
MWISREAYDDIMRRLSDLEGRGAPHIFYAEDIKDKPWRIFGWDECHDQSVDITLLLAEIANHLGIETELNLPARVFRFKSKK